MFAYVPDGIPPSIRPAGRLAQLGQSACLTSRRSPVRARDRPSARGPLRRSFLVPSHCWGSPGRDEWKRPGSATALEDRGGGEEIARLGGWSPSSAPRFSPLREHLEGSTGALHRDRRLRTRGRRWSARLHRRRRTEHHGRRATASDPQPRAGPGMRTGLAARRRRRSVGARRATARR
jgi:hypothetical protein